MLPQYISPSIFNAGLGSFPGAFTQNTLLDLLPFSFSGNIYFPLFFLSKFWHRSSNIIITRVFDQGFIVLGILSNFLSPSFLIYKIWSVTFLVLEKIHLKHLYQCLTYSRCSESISYAVIILNAKHSICHIIRTKHIFVE